MRLVSFDVGINHLAYCILENGIVDWNVLNVSGVVYCDKCRAKAVYRKETRFVCAKHTKEFPLPPQNKTIAELKVLQAECKIPGKWTKKALVEQLALHYNCWETVAPAKIDLISVGRNIYRQLSQNEHMSTVTHVIIENQMSERMKTVQGMLAQYFIGKEVPNIEFVSSSHKLKSFLAAEKEEKEEKEEQEEKQTYSKNKKDSIRFCRKVLERFPEKIPFWESFKGKKDDLADSLLQGIWFLNQEF